MTIEAPATVLVKTPQDSTGTNRTVSRWHGTISESNLTSAATNGEGNLSYPTVGGDSIDIITLTGNIYLDEDCTIDFQNVTFDLRNFVIYIHPDANIFWKDVLFLSYVTRDGPNVTIFPGWGRWNADGGGILGLQKGSDGKDRMHVFVGLINNVQVRQDSQGENDMSFMPFLSSGTYRNVKVLGTNSINMNGNTDVVNQPIIMHDCEFRSSNPSNVGTRLGVLNNGSMILNDCIFGRMDREDPVDGGGGGSTSWIYENHSGGVTRVPHHVYFCGGTKIRWNADWSRASSADNQLQSHQAGLRYYQVYKSGAVFGGCKYRYYSSDDGGTTIAARKSQVTTSNNEMLELPSAEMGADGKFDVMTINKTRYFQSGINSWETRQYSDAYIRLRERSIIFQDVIVSDPTISVGRPDTPVPFVVQPDPHFDASTTDISIFQINQRVALDFTAKTITIQHNTLISVSELYSYLKALHAEYTNFHHDMDQTYDGTTLSLEDWSLVIGNNCTLATLGGGTRILAAMGDITIGSNFTNSGVTLVDQTGITVTIGSPNPGARAIIRYGTSVHYANVESDPDDDTKNPWSSLIPIATEVEVFVKAPGYSGERYRFNTSDQILLDARLPRESTVDLAVSFTTAERNAFTLRDHTNYNSGNDRNLADGYLEIAVDNIQLRDQFKKSRRIFDWHMSTNSGLLFQLNYTSSISGDPLQGRPYAYEPDRIRMDVSNTDGNGKIRWEKVAAANEDCRVGDPVYVPTGSDNMSIYNAPSTSLGKVIFDNVIVQGRVGEEVIADAATRLIENQTFVRALAKGNWDYLHTSTLVDDSFGKLIKDKVNNIASDVWGYTTNDASHFVNTMGAATLSFFEDYYVLEEKLNFTATDNMDATTYKINAHIDSVADTINISSIDEKLTDIESTVDNLINSLLSQVLIDGSLSSPPVPDTTIHSVLRTLGSFTTQRIAGLDNLTVNLNTLATATALTNTQTTIIDSIDADVNAIRAVTDRIRLGDIGADGKAKIDSNATVTGRVESSGLTEVEAQMFQTLFHAVVNPPIVEVEAGEPDAVPYANDPTGITRRDAKTLYTTHSTTLDTLSDSGAKVEISTALPRTYEGLAHYNNKLYGIADNTNIYEFTAAAPTTPSLFAVDDSEGQGAIDGITIHDDTMYWIRNAPNERFYEALAPKELLSVDDITVDGGNNLLYILDTTSRSILAYNATNGRRRPAKDISIKVEVATPKFIAAGHKAKNQLALYDEFTDSIHIIKTDGNGTTRGEIIETFTPSNRLTGVVGIMFDSNRKRIFKVAPGTSALSYKAYAFNRADGSRVTANDWDVPTGGLRSNPTPTSRTIFGMDATRVGSSTQFAVLQRINNRLEVVVMVLFSSGDVPSANTRVHHLFTGIDTDYILNMGFATLGSARKLWLYNVDISSLVRYPSPNSIAPIQATHAESAGTISIADTTLPGFDTNAIAHAVINSKSYILTARVVDGDGTIIAIDAGTGDVTDLSDHFMFPTYTVSSDGHVLGLLYHESHLYVLHEGSTQVRSYASNGARVGTNEWTLVTDDTDDNLNNALPCGITHHGGKFYVADFNSNVFAYDDTTHAHDTVASWSLLAAHTREGNITVYGDHFYVINPFTHSVHSYDINGAAEEGRDIILHNSRNYTSQALAVDPTNHLMYVVYKRPDTLITKLEVYTLTQTNPDFTLNYMDMGATPPRAVSAGNINSIPTTLPHIESDASITTNGDELFVLINKRLYTMDFSGDNVHEVAALTGSTEQSRIVFWRNYIWHYHNTSKALEPLYLAAEIETETETLPLSKIDALQQSIDRFPLNEDATAILSELTHGVDITSVADTPVTGIAEFKNETPIAANLTHVNNTAVEDDGGKLDVRIADVKPGTGDTNRLEVDARLVKGQPIDAANGVLNVNVKNVHGTPLTNGVTDFHTSTSSIVSAIMTHILGQNQAGDDRTVAQALQTVMDRGDLAEEIFNGVIFPLSSTEGQAAGSLISARMVLQYLFNPDTTVTGNDLSGGGLTTIKDAVQAVLKHVSWNYTFSDGPDDNTIMKVINPDDTTEIFKQITIEESGNRTVSDPPDP